MSSDQPAPLLEISKVSKRYDERQVLRDVSLVVGTSEALFLLGGNGAGKSTLMKIIAARLRPDSGEVRIGGQSMRKRRTQVASLIGMIGHEPGLHASLSVEENLQWYAQALGVKHAKERSQELIQQFALERVRGQEASSLSRGQAQRVGLARAMLAKPPLLLLDEPFTGLDEKARQLLLSHLKDYLQEGGAILITSHDLILADELATRSVWLRKGKIDSEADALGRFKAAMRA